MRLKRIDFPNEVTLSVYERMKSSRHRDAKLYRSEGAAEAEKIRAEADKEAGLEILWKGHFHQQLDLKAIL